MADSKDFGYDCCIHYNYHDGPDDRRDSDHRLSENFLDTLRQKLSDMRITDLNFKNLKPDEGIVKAFTEDYLKCKKFVIVITEGFTNSHLQTYFTQIGMMDKIQSGKTNDVLALSLGVSKSQLMPLGLSILKIVYFDEDESKWESQDSESQWEQVAKFFKDLTELKKRSKLETILIEQDSTGHSYENLFGKCFDDKNIERVTLEDPFIRYDYQLNNFEDFCELVREKKKTGMCSVKVIELITVKCEAEECREKKEKKLEMKEKADEKFAKIHKSLERNGITLEVNYIKDLHDRQIRLDTGRVISLSRGLDIYKTDNEGKDQNSRKCRKNTIHIIP